ncbi:polyhydroxyalkanoic acid system family protein [Qipengyuania sp. JC766]|uniref:polyhydroxyalkanoic acid system family protein n=1 Tax=Qipengyuania sp. JC766 TaxID=3232139 RepID=UPI0034599BBF
MRVAIPHDLPRDEVRRRMNERTPDLGKYIPGGMADVKTEWLTQDRMQMRVAAMGQTVAGHVDIEDTQLVFQLDLPPALSFFAPVVEKAVRANGEKLLAPPNS